MGFFARLFGSKKETEAPLSEPTSAQLRQTLELLATQLGEEGKDALASAAQTADQMRSIVTEVSSETDLLKRYSKAIRKSSDLQAKLTSLNFEQTNAKAEKVATEGDSESEKRAALKCATIDLQLSLVRETKERVRLFLPAEE